MTSRYRILANASTVLPKASAAQIESYVTMCMGLFDVTREEAIAGAIQMCGSLDVAALAVGAEMERGKADLMQAFPDGVENSNGVWDGDFANIRSFAFDFVDGQGRYISTPKDIKIYTMTSAFRGPDRVFSLEQGIEGEGRERQAEMERIANYWPYAPHGHNVYDKNWETYVIPAGIELRIMQDGHADRFLPIPVRPHPPTYNVLQLQPWQQ